MICAIAAAVVFTATAKLSALTATVEARYKHQNELDKTGERRQGEIMAENNSEFVGGSAEKQKAFGDDLRALINKYSLENDSNTPDIVLACYLLSCLQAFNQSVNSRANLGAGKII